MSQAEKHRIRITATALAVLIGVATPVRADDPTPSVREVGQAPDPRLKSRAIENESTIPKPSVGDGRAVSPLIEPVTLWPMYQRRALASCEYVGYSAGDGYEDALEMKAANANASGGGWGFCVPVPLEEAPNGCTFLAGSSQEARQEFSLSEPFRGIVFETSAHKRRGPPELCALTIRLYRRGDDKRSLLASERFDSIGKSLTTLELRFDAQPPGQYLLELADVENLAGVWLTTETDLLQSQLCLDDTRINGESLVFAHIAADGRNVPHGNAKRRHWQALGRRDALRSNSAAGLKSCVWAGSHNNALFSPLYPEWFYEKHADLGMIGADGKTIMGGFLGVKKPWPSIEHPVITDNVARYLRHVGRRLKDEQDVLFIVLGGETLYPTYLDPPLGPHDKGYPDYGQDALDHFRAWLERKYGHIAALNELWTTEHSDFRHVQPPRDKVPSVPLLDWLDFRFASMAERMQWMYEAVRSEDHTHVLVPGTHGDLFASDKYVALGSDLQQFACVADGLELSPIMWADDPRYYNLMWASATAGLGKLLMPTRLAYVNPDPKARRGISTFTPAAARRYSIEAFGSGWWYLGLVQWSNSIPDGDWGIRGTPAEQELRRVFADIHRTRPAAEAAWPVLPKIGLYLSHPRWTLQQWDDDWTALHIWSIQHHYDKAVVWEQQLLSGEAEPFPVLISPNNDLMSLEALAALERYVQRGGHVILIGDTAVRDPLGRAVPASARAFLRGERVHHVQGPINEVLSRLPKVLLRAGVRPFCRLIPVETARPIEAFTLFDGASFVVPMVSLADDDLTVTLELDADILVGDAGDYTLFDALSGAMLAEGAKAELTVPARGYRIIEARRRADARDVRKRLEAAVTFAEKHDDCDVSFQRTCLERAASSLEAARFEKARAHLNRLEAQPLVQAVLCGQHESGDVEVELECHWPDGEPFEGAVGALRVVPVYDAVGAFVETQPGRYRAVIPASALVAYDYAARRYRPYHGPLEAVANLWRRRVLAQYSQAPLSAPGEDPN